MTTTNSRVMAQIIRQRRIMEGFTQMGVSRVCGVSVSQLSRVERGLAFPSADFLTKIARPLNINVSDLLTYAACIALNEPGVRDKSLREITGALKLAMANNHQEPRSEKPV